MQTLAPGGDSPLEAGGSGPTRWLAAVVASVLVVTTVANLWLVWRAAVAAPFQDEFLFWPLFRGALRGEFDLAEMVRPFNGHPYLTTKPIMWLAIRTGVPWSVLYYGSVLLVAACAAGCARLVWREGEAALPWRPGAVIVGILVAATPRQWENFYWGMQIAFPIWLGLSLTASVAAGHYGRTRRVGWALVCSAACLGALVSLGAGLVTLLAIAGLLALGDEKGRRLGWLGLLVTGMAVWWTIAALAPPSSAPSVAARLTLLVRDPLRAVEYLLMFLGNGVFGEEVRGLRVLTLVGGAVLLGLMGFALWEGGRALPRNVGPVALVLLTLGSAGGLLLSRYGVGIDQPNAPRYVPLVVPGVVGAVVVASRTGRRRGNGSGGVRVGLLLLGALSVLGYGAALRREWLTSPYRKANLAPAAVALCGGDAAGVVPLLVGVAPRYVRFDIVRAAFCADGRATSPITHDGLRGARVGDAEGFHVESDQTWVAPRARFSAHLKGPAHFRVRGWIPDIERYPDGRFVLSLRVSGELVLTMQQTRGGDFVIEGSAGTGSAGKAQVEIEASEVQPAANGDRRRLAWILKELAWE